MDFSRNGRLAYLLLETPLPGQAAATHANEMIAGLRRCGWEVDVFVSNSGGAASGTTFLRRLGGYLLTQLALFARWRRFDAVYVRAHFMALPTAFVAWLLRKPIFHEVNGIPNDITITYPRLRSIGFVFARLYRYQFRRATRLLPVTDGLAVWLREFAQHNRITVVPNGANLALFTPDGPTAAIAGRYVIFVGGLVRWHGIETMLSATKDPSWPLDVRLVVLGDGLERDVVSRASAAGPGSRVDWLGRTDYELVPRFIRGALAALCPIENPLGRSLHGVAPLKLYEAMGCGVPVIVTDLPFQADLVRSIGAGIVVPPRDPPALAAAIRQLVENEPLRRASGAAGTAYVRAHASWNERAGQVSALLTEVVETRE